MEEIKVGEYVRLDDGTIGKYQINKNWINVVETNDKDIGFDIEKDIIKHSFNIIDLIEVGDYVNGHKILEIKQNVESGLRYLMYNYVPIKYYVERKDSIKSIVTKEQFKSVEYIVGGKE